MKQKSSIKSNQNGIGLVEALVAVALSSIVILGAVFGTGRILVSQKEKNLQYIVVNELRADLQKASSQEKNAWCNGDSKPEIKLPNEKDAVEIKVTCESMEATVSNPLNSTYNKTITDKQPIKFEINSNSLGGKITIGEELK